jgi:poly(ADP-ribose) glycohydrolase ARH3
MVDTGRSVLGQQAELSDRIAGAMLAAACGDGLGARFEGQQHVAAGTLRQHVHESRNAIRWTDDTVQMMVLARHVSRGAGLEQDRLADELAAAWLQEPDRGYGRGASDLLRRIGEGESWRVAAPSLFDGMGSLGNGAAMRVCPIGLMPLPLSEVDRVARESAAVSHTHPLAQDAAALQALAVALALRDEPFDVLADYARTPEFRTVVRRLPLVPPQDLNHDVSALGSVPAAWAVARRHIDDPVAAIELAISLGRDTDTVASMSAAIVGARCGVIALPPSWIARLERAEEIRNVATVLASLADGRRP